MRVKLVAAAACVGSVSLLTNSGVRRQLSNRLLQLLGAIEGMGPAGVVLYVGVFVVAAQAMVPSTLLELAAGFLFANTYGVAVAVLLGTLGKQGSSGFSFVLGRTLLQDYVKETVLPRFPVFERASRALESDHVALICLIRLSPIPNAAKSLGLAVTGVPTHVFFAVSVLFGLPWTILSVLVGATLVSITELQDQAAAKKKMWALAEPWLSQPVTVAVCSLSVAILLYSVSGRLKGILQKYNEIVDKTK